jgi:hypothetical protein
LDEGPLPWRIRNTFIDIQEDKEDQADSFFNTAPSAYWPYSSLQPELRGGGIGNYLPSAIGRSTANCERGITKKDNQMQPSSEEEDGEFPEDGEILSNEPEEGELLEDEKESEDPDQEQSPPEATKAKLPPSGCGSGRRSRKTSAVYPPPPPGEPVPSKGSARHYSGTCRPCAWLHRSDGSGCRNAENCLYCHLCPEGELKQRKKTKLQRRMDEVRQIRDRMRMSDVVAVVGPAPGRTTPAMADGRAAVAGAVGGAVVLDVPAMEPCYIEVRSERLAPGSLGHNFGRCRPCAWFYKDSSGCRNGSSCRYCHLCPPGELKRRKRDKWDTQRPLLSSFPEEAAVTAEPVRIAAGGQ